MTPFPTCRPWAGSNWMPVVALPVPLRCRGWYRAPGPVRLRMPDGLDLAPDVADKIAAYLGERRS